MNILWQRHIHACLRTPSSFQKAYHFFIRKKKWYAFWNMPFQKAYHVCVLGHPLVFKYEFPNSKKHAIKKKINNNCAPSWQINTTKIKHRNNYGDRFFPWKSNWCTKATSRAAFFAWTASPRKIVTMDNLRQRHIVVIDWSCICKRSCRSIEHLLLHCKIASATGHAQKS